SGVSRSLLLEGASLAVGGRSGFLRGSGTVASGAVEASSWAAACTSLHSSRRDWTGAPLGAEAYEVGCSGSLVPGPFPRPPGRLHHATRALVPGSRAGECGAAVRWSSIVSVVVRRLVGRRPLWASWCGGSLAVGCGRFERAPVEGAVRRRV